MAYVLCMQCSIYVHLIVIIQEFVKYADHWIVEYILELLVRNTLQVPKRYGSSIIQWSTQGNYQCQYLMLKSKLKHQQYQISEQDSIQKCCFRFDLFSVLKRYKFIFLCWHEWQSWYDKRREILIRDSFFSTNIWIVFLITPLFQIILNDYLTHHIFDHSINCD